jgi:hypothetical protein
MSRGGGKSSGQVIGYRYFMDILAGISRGPVNEIVEIKVGGRTAWSGSQAETGDIEINAPDLFGGDDKEGGIKGRLRVQMGRDDQIVPNDIKTRIGGVVSDMRGALTTWFSGLICSNNPYPKPWEYRVRRTTAGWDGPVWYPETATIWLADGKIRAMNGAHIIYECLTNRQWGRGLPREALDDLAFRDAAKTLFDEGFGLCIRWTRQEDVGEFIQQIVNHIGATLYPDRSTGLITLRLVRGDYNPDDLPTFTYETGLVSVEQDETAASDASINEVVVIYRDPITNKDQEAREQNLASLQSSGAVNSVRIEYPGIPTADLAQRVATRDLRVQSAALKRYKVVLDRRAWRMYVGAVFRIHDPDAGINYAIVRAGSVREKNILDGRIEVSAVLDVFGMSALAPTQQPVATWVAPDTTALIAPHRALTEFTYRDMVRYVPPGELAVFPETASLIAAVAVRPTPISLNYGLATQAEGEPFFVERAVSPWAASGVLSGAISATATTLVLADAVDLDIVDFGNALDTCALLGSEVVGIVNVDPGTNTVTIARGCCGTIAVPHQAGTRLFFYDRFFTTDQRDYEDGETISAKVLTRTATTRIDPSLAPIDSITVRRRWSRPYPPADLRIGGTHWTQVGWLGSGAVVFEWKHRNRVLQQDQLVPDSDANGTIESGVTYEIRVFHPRSATPTVAVRTVTGLTGTTWTYTAADRMADGNPQWTRFVVRAVKSGVESWQVYDFERRRDEFVADSGYGDSYGDNYGG